MKEGQASRTAEYMALFRALETARPRARRSFEDPFATAFLGPRLRVVAALGRLPFLGDRIRSYIDRRWAGVLTSGVARTGFIDDACAAGLPPARHGRGHRLRVGPSLHVGGQGARGGAPRRRTLFVWEGVTEFYRIAAARVPPKETA